MQRSLLPVEATSVPFVFIVPLKLDIIITFRYVELEHVDVHDGPQQSFRDSKAFDSDKLVYSTI